MFGHPLACGMWITRAKMYQPGADAAAIGGTRLTKALLSRRDIIQGLVACAAGTGLAAPAIAAPSPRLFLIRQRTGEVFRGSHVKTGFSKKSYDPAALNELNWLLRDVRASAVIGIDPRLIDLLARMQARLPDRPITIISAFRTTATNARLHGASPTSYHLTGQAVDLRIAGLNTRQIRNLAHQQGAGGVGLYRRRNFVHVDTGPRRDWTG